MRKYLWFVVNGKEIEDDVEFCYFCGADYSDNIIEDSIDNEINCCPVCRGKLEKGKIEVFCSLKRMAFFVHVVTNTLVSLSRDKSLHYIKEDRKIDIGEEMNKIVSSPFIKI